MSWKDDQKWELDWWQGAINTYQEEQKQLETYAPKMGLNVLRDSQGVYLDAQGKSILDVGGGPCSLLLKTKNFSSAVIIDPCEYPDWVAARYEYANIYYILAPAENMLRISEIVGTMFDEVWIYNVLQHVENPEQIVKNIRSISKIIRVFDWLDIGVAPGHPHNLTEDVMNMWYGGVGKTVPSNIGREYFGIFLGDHYERSNLPR